MNYKKTLSSILITSICLTGFSSVSQAKDSASDNKSDNETVNPIAYSVLSDQNLEELLKKNEKEYIYFVSFDKVTNDKQYTVKSTDTLKSISEQFNVNTTVIIDENEDLIVTQEKQSAWLNKYKDKNGVIDSTSNIGLYEGLTINLGTVMERTSMEILLKDKQSIDSKIKSLGLLNPFIESKISKDAYMEMKKELNNTPTENSKMSKKENKKALENSKKLLKKLRNNPDAILSADNLLQDENINANLISEELKNQLQKNTKKQNKLKEELDKALKDSLKIIKKQQKEQRQREEEELNALQSTLDSTIEAPTLDTSTETENTPKESSDVISNDFTRQLVSVGLSEELANNYTKSLDYAYTLLGVPYVFGGASESGIDCSGYVYRAYNAGGISIPRTTALGYYNMSTLIENPVPGDLVFFVNTYKAGISHIGIYIGDNKMINAVGDYVQITDMTSNYWSSKFAGYGRLTQLMNK